MGNNDYPRILKPPRRSFFLFGARGIGKSTWIRKTYPDAITFNLLDEGLYQELLANPSLFAARLRALKPRAWVCLDEVQRLPGLLNEVHRAIEELRLRFVLSGSSARKLRRSGSNLLAGRALEHKLFPFVPEELGADFDLERILEHGSVPIVWSSDGPRETLKAYVQTYLREEVQAEALVRNLAGFARFLPIAALFHGQVMNVSAVARDAGVSRTTVVGFLEVLEETLLAFWLPAFEARLRVRERRHPKLYWIDPGLVRAVKKQLGPVIQEERGTLFEGWLATLLRAYGDYRELFDDMYYWAPGEAEHTEVDFLLQRRNAFVAIEAKATRRLRTDAFRGLRAVADLKGLRRRVLVYLGADVLRTEDGIDVWPVATLLEKLQHDSLW